MFMKGRPDMQNRGHIGTEQRARLALFFACLNLSEMFTLGVSLPACVMGRQASHQCLVRASNERMGRLMHSVEMFMKVHCKCKAERVGQAAVLPLTSASHRTPFCQHLKRANISSTAHSENY